jgi:hypothetical protein
MSRNRFYDQRIVLLKEMFSSNNDTALSILDNMQSVYEAKDNDYSATGRPMGNLRKCEDAGIDAWRGCLVRIGDKMSRLENFLKEKEYLVISEKAEDTVIDLANYAILMSCLIEEIKPSHSDFYWNLSEQAQARLLKLSYYCVFQAMLWKDNDPENDLSNLEKALSYWDMLCDYSLEMN